MEKSLQMLDRVLPYIIIAVSFTLIMTLIAAGFYVWVYFHKRINLKQAKEIKEEFREKTEYVELTINIEAYKEALNKLIEDVKELVTKKKNLEKQVEDLETKKKVQERK